jgi:hypothetical protein
MPETDETENFRTIFKVIKGFRARERKGFYNIDKLKRHYSMKRYGTEKNHRDWCCFLTSNISSKKDRKL